MGFWNKILKPFQAVADWVGNASEKTGQWINNAWEDTTQWVSNAWEDTTQWLGNAWDTVNGKSKDIYGASFSEIANMPNEITNDIAKSDFATDIVRGIDDFAKSPIGQDIKDKIIEDYMPLLPDEEKDKTKLMPNDVTDPSKNTPMPTTPPTQKGTGENEMQDIMSLYDEMRANDLADQQRQWEREDELRKEQYAREDSAFSRAVTDMRKAGINPELVGISPLSSGSASVNTASVNNSSGNMINSLSTIITSKISNEVKVDENQKDRINDIIRTAITLLLLKGK